MKNQEISIFLTVLLLSLMTRFTTTLLPFSSGKYLYWLPVIIIGGNFFLLKNINRKWSVNRFDICLLILFCIGLFNFIYASKATVFNLKVWFFTGYLFLYMILRRSLDTREKNLDLLNTALYLIFFAALLNAIIAILQKNQVLSSSNEYFQSTGLFFSPNQLALLLALGSLSSIELIKKAYGFRKILFFTGFVILVYGLYLSKCKGAYIALSLTLFFTINNLFIQNKSFTILKKSLSAAMFLVGLFFVICNIDSFKSESVSGRIFIAKQSLLQLKNQLLTGYGFDSFSLQYNIAKANYFSCERPWAEIKNASFIYNASNDFLELSFDLGIIWIVTFCFLLLMLFAKSKHNNVTRTSSSMLLCLIIFMLTNSILPVPLFMVLGCIFTVIIINELNAKPICFFANNILFQIIPITFLLIFLVIIILRVNAEYRLMEIYNDREVSNLKKTINYTSKIDANGEQFFMTGIIFLKNSKQEEGILYLTNGFEQSGKPSLGKSLASFLERMRRYDDAEKIYIYNKNVEPFRFDARIDLFYLYLKTNQKAKAKTMAIEIVKLPVKIPSNKVDKFKEEARGYLKK